MEVNWEALKLCTVYKKPYLFIVSQIRISTISYIHKNPYQVLQVMCIYLNMQ